MKKTLIGLALGIATIASAQVDNARTVVVINGEEIKGAEYYHRMEFLDGVGKPMGNGVAQFPPGFLTIETMITERLILQLAKNKGVSPSEPEIDNELKLRIEDDPKYLESWLNSGRSQNDLRYQVRLQLAQFKIATTGVNVADQEIEGHYKANGAMYTVPRKVKLSVIAVSDADTAAKVDAELKAKKPFADVAKALSEDITKSVGGELGDINYPFLSDTVKAAIDKIKIGETTEWLTSADKKIKFALRGATPETKLELTPKLKREIRKRLLLDKGRVKNDVAKEMQDLRAKSNIDIKDKSFADAYAKFIEAYRKDLSLKGSGG